MEKEGEWDEMTDGGRERERGWGRGGREGGYTHMMVNMLDRDDDSVHTGRHTKVPLLYIDLFLAVPEPRAYRSKQ